MPDMPHAMRHTPCDTRCAACPADLHGAPFLIPGAHSHSSPSTFPGVRSHPRDVTRVGSVVDRWPPVLIRRHALYLRSIGPCLPFAMQSAHADHGPHYNNATHNAATTHRAEDVAELMRQRRGFGGCWDGRCEFGPSGRRGATPSRVALQVPTGVSLGVGGVHVRCQDCGGSVSIGIRYHVRIGGDSFWRQRYTLTAFELVLSYSLSASAVLEFVLQPARIPLFHRTLVSSRSLGYAIAGPVAALINPTLAIKASGVIRLDFTRFTVTAGARISMTGQVGYTLREGGVMTGGRPQIQRVFRTGGGLVEGSYLTAKFAIYPAFALELFGGFVTFNVNVKPYLALSFGRRDSCSCRNLPVEVTASYGIEANCDMDPIVFDWGVGSTQLVARWASDNYPIMDPRILGSWCLEDLPPASIMSALCGTSSSGGGNAGGGGGTGHTNPRPTPPPTGGGYISGGGGGGRPYTSTSTPTRRGCVNDGSTQMTAWGNAVCVCGGTSSCTGPGCISLYAGSSQGYATTCSQCRCQVPNHWPGSPNPQPWNGQYSSWAGLNPPGPPGPTPPPVYYPPPPPWRPPTNRASCNDGRYASSECSFYGSNCRSCYCYHQGGGGGYCDCCPTPPPTRPPPPPPGWSRWGAFNAWTSCANGGQQRRARVRQCNSPPPAGGRSCSGSAREEETRACPGWTDWAPWTEWTPCAQSHTTAIGTLTGARARTRGCTDPAPVSVEQDCDGEPSERQTRFCCAPDRAGGVVWNATAPGATVEIACRDHHPTASLGVLRRSCLSIAATSATWRSVAGQCHATASPSPANRTVAASVAFQSRNLSGWSFTSRASPGTSASSRINGSDSDEARIQAAVAAAANVSASRVSTTGTTFVSRGGRGRRQAPDGSDATAGVIWQGEISGLADDLVPSVELSLNELAASSAGVALAMSGSLAVGSIDQSVQGCKCKDEVLFKGILLRGCDPASLTFGSGFWCFIEDDFEGCAGEPAELGIRGSAPWDACSVASTPELECRVTSSAHAPANTMFSTRGHFGRRPYFSTKAPSSGATGTDAPPPLFLYHGGPRFHFGGNDSIANRTDEFSDGIVADWNLTSDAFMDELDDFIGYGASLWYIGPTLGSEDDYVAKCCDSDLEASFESILPSEVGRGGHRWSNGANDDDASLRVECTASGTWQDVAPATGSADDESDRLIWTPINVSRGCATNREGTAMPPLANLTSVSDLASCKSRCATEYGCTAVDWSAAGSRCVLFDRSCMFPIAEGVSSFRIAGSRCAEGQYRRGSACRSCRTCPPGTRVTDACGASNDTVCGECPAGTFQPEWGQPECRPVTASCAAGTFASAAATPTTDTACSDCSNECGDGSFIAAACTPAADTACRTCEPCPAAGQYKQGCAGPDAGTCATCMACGAGLVVRAVCAGTTDTECGQCAAGTFLADGNTDGACSPCSVCGLGSFSENGCTDSTDTVCHACSVCPASTFAATSCLDNATIMHCSPCTACPGGHATECTSQNDATCTGDVPTSAAGASDADGGGATAGVIVGIVVVIALLLGAVVHLRRKREGAKLEAAHGASDRGGGVAGVGNDRAMVMNPAHELPAVAPAGTAGSSGVLFEIPMEGAPNGERRPTVLVKGSVKKAVKKGIKKRTERKGSVYDGFDAPELVQEGAIPNFSYRVLTPDDPHYDRAAAAAGGAAPVYNLATGAAQPTYGAAVGQPQYNLASAGGQANYDTAAASRLYTGAPAGGQPTYDAAATSRQPQFNLASAGGQANYDTATTSRQPQYNLAAAGGQPLYHAATQAATATAKAGSTLPALPQGDNLASAGRGQVISKESPHFYINGHMDTSEDATC